MALFQCLIVGHGQAPLVLGSLAGGPLRVAGVLFSHGHLVNRKPKSPRFTSSYMLHSGLPS